jgi:hypothetical protein
MIHDRLPLRPLPRNLAAWAETILCSSTLRWRNRYGGAASGILQPVTRVSVDNARAVLAGWTAR